MARGKTTSSHKEAKPQGKRMETTEAGFSAGSLRPAQSPRSAVLVPVLNEPLLDCETVATQVRAIIRSFHTSVASPLASIGLQLELLRMDPETSKAASAELRRITKGLDEVITVVRGANRELRKLEHQMLERKSEAV